MGTHHNLLLSHLGLHHRFIDFASHMTEVNVKAVRILVSQFSLNWFQFTPVDLLNVLLEDPRLTENVWNNVVVACLVILI